MLHLEVDEDGISWWADSSTHPEFNAFADSMRELKELVREAAEMEGWPEPTFTLEGRRSVYEGLETVLASTAA